MTRRLLIAGNWKMNGLLQQAQTLAKELASLFKQEKDPAFDMLVCPPFTALSVVRDSLSDSGILLGGQDCHFKESGAHTGDISPAMLKDAWCDAVILGHSERRQNHAETSALVREKAQAAHQEGLLTIICVGETETQRDAGQTLTVVGEQVQESLPKDATAQNTVIAYEPVWAIGTGKVASVQDVAEVHAFIRSEIEKTLGKETAEAVRILYGGSVKPSNAKELLSLQDVDGALVGGASLKSADFWAIAKSQD
jgi:triosephosphate isomerase (TIM)